MYVDNIMDGIGIQPLTTLDYRLKCSQLTVLFQRTASWRRIEPIQRYILYSKLTPGTKPQAEGSSDQGQISFLYYTVYMHRTKYIYRFSIISRFHKQVIETSVLLSNLSSILHLFVKPESSISVGTISSPRNNLLGFQLQCL